ncbi:MAG: LacI family DNA-binding transcriptional regulator [bacterium]
MAVTRDDVADLAGVSAATVSYVVNDGPRPVSEETRKKVLRAIEQLDYQPSAIARGLRTKKTFLVGIVISDILNPTLAVISKTVEDSLLQQDYSLHVCNSDESPNRELIWLRTLIRRRVDGIILLPTGSNRPMLSSVVDSGTELVLIDREVEGLKSDCVLFNNEAGAYEAVSHLIELGHSRISLLGLPASLTPGHERRRGYEKALSDAGLPVIPALTREAGFKAREGYELAGELLDVDPPPTALFAASSRLAHSVLHQVKQRGLQMPDDIALAVFDDVEYYTYTSPSITAVSSNLHEFANRAVEFLIDRIDGSYTGAPRIARVLHQLEVRESTIGFEGSSSKPA